MTKFAYKNTKIIKIEYISFKLKSEYYLQVLFTKDTNLYFKSILVNKLADKVKNLMSVYQKNLYYTQKL